MRGFLDGFKKTSFLEAELEGGEFAREEGEDC
jgi:hypothetical protein